MTGETVVRIGDLQASATPGDVLLTIGLGSCIGLVLVDTRRSIAGLAHVMLPVPPSGDVARPGKFATTATPALTAAVEELGAARIKLRAILVGGAAMFQVGSNLDVGARNEEAVRQALAELRIPVAAAATGGEVGRTVRVDVERCSVRVKEAGGTDVEIFGGAGRTVLA